MRVKGQGISGDARNNNDNVHQEFLDLTTKAGLTFNASDLDRCHRLGKPKAADSYRKVIIKLTNADARQQVHQSRKKLGEGIFAQGNFTRLRQQLSQATTCIKNKMPGQYLIAGYKVFRSLPGSGTGTTKTILIKEMSVVQSIKDGNVSQ